MDGENGENPVKSSWVKVFHSSLHNLHTNNWKNKQPNKIKQGQNYMRHTQTHGYINIYILQHSRSPQLPPPSALSIRWASRPPHRSLYLEQQRGGEHHDTFRSSRFHPEICRPIAWPEPKLRPCWDRLVRFGKLEHLLFGHIPSVGRPSILHLCSCWLNHWTIPPRKSESNHNQTQTQPTSVDRHMQYTVSVFGI